jgi:ABC-type transporter MlaC component
MNIRKSVAGVALVGLAVFGVAACSDDSDSDSAGSTASSVAAETSADTSGAQTSESASATALEGAKAQEILRAVLSPETAPADSAKLVDSTDPAIGAQLSGMSRGFTAAGYTPDKFTVTTVTLNGPNNATANVEVASPHTPQPVAMPIAYVYSGGEWKLAASSITDLVSMGSSHG